MNKREKYGGGINSKGAITSLRVQITVRQEKCLCLRETDQMVHVTNGEMPFGSSNIKNNFCGFNLGLTH